jgi:hypothetical protein
MSDEDRGHIQEVNLPVVQIIGVLPEGWAIFDLASLGASVLMFGIAVGLVIWLFEIRSLASHQ